VSFYFVSTTVTTVGYGDITAENLVEKVFAIFMLFVGVLTFAFASGQLSSILTNYDNK
jgi:voltage-gated potassium channel